MLSPTLAMATLLDVPVVDVARVQVAITVRGTLNDSTDVDHGWIAEIAIPFADIAPYAPHLPQALGDIWRLNLYRIDDRSNRQYSLWSDTRRPRPQFDAPERFGVVRFVAPEARGADHRGGP